MKTVTMSLEEFDQLRSIELEMNKNNKYMCYPSTLGGDLVYYHFVTNDEEIIHMAEDNNKLEEEIRRLNQIIDKYKHQTLIQRLFNR